MAFPNTTFIPRVTVITAEWLQAVNDRLSTNTIDPVLVEGDQLVGGVKTFTDVTRVSSLNIGYGTPGEKVLIIHNSSRYLHFYLSADGTTMGMWDATANKVLWSFDSLGNFVSGRDIAAGGGPEGPISLINLDGRLTALSNSITGINTGTGTNTGDQIAATVPFTPTGTIAATNVQDAIAEVMLEAGGGSGGGASTAADISFTPVGTISATNVQAAIAEVAAEASGSSSTIGSYTGTAVGIGYSTYIAPQPPKTGVIKYTVVSNVVTMDFPEFSGRSDGTLFYVTGGPVDMRPAVPKRVLAPITVYDSSIRNVDTGEITGGYIDRTGSIVINPDGVIYIYPDIRQHPTEPYLDQWSTGGNNKVVYSCSFSYTLA